MNIIPGAELAARRTAAAAVLADYQRDAQTADVADRAMWAARLAGMLGTLLAPAQAHAAPAAAPPIETEQQARELPAVRAVYAAFAATPGEGRMIAGNKRMLLDACRASGVSLGAYDGRIIDWLGGWEPEVCAVVAGLITRAAGPALDEDQRAALGHALADALRFRGDPALAGLYRELARQLGIAVEL